MKNLFLSLLAMFAVVGTVSAQDAPVNRSLSFYLDSITGHLTDDAAGNSRLFQGNEFEFGMIYAQNFATVPWLTLSAKALIATGVNPEYDADGSWVGNQGGGGNYFVQPYALPRVLVGVNLGGYSFIGMDTRGLLANENYYTIRFGAAGALTFQTILEMFVIPIVSDIEVGGVVVDQDSTVLDLFEIRLNYEIGFAPGWVYRTKLGFRFQGGGNDDSAEAFAQSFGLRWENQVVWSITPSFYTWAQLRYHAANIANSGATVDHQLFLQAGLGYSFDFSNN